METSERSADSREPVTSVCFETPRGTKLAAKFYAVLLASSLPPIAVVLSLLVSIDVLRLAPALVAVVVSAVVMLVVAISWKYLAPTLRFCVIFHLEHLQVGRGWTRSLFAYEDVDVVSCMSRRDRLGEDLWIHVRGGRRTAKVRLARGSRDRCMALMRDCCPNALLVVESGDYYLPANPTRPQQTAIALQDFLGRARRRRAWIRLLGACGGIGLVGWLARDLILCWQGNRQVGEEEVRLSAIVILLTGGALWEAWKRRRTTRGERAQ